MKLEKYTKRITFLLHKLIHSLFANLLSSLQAPALASHQSQLEKFVVLTSGKGARFLVPSDHLLFLKIFVSFVVKTKIIFLLLYP